VYINLGNCLQYERKIEEAIEVYLNVLELDPRYVLAHRNLALLYEEMSRVDDSRKHAELAIQYDEGDVESHIVISRQDCRAKRPDLAR